MLGTRGISIPIQKPNISALEYFRHFVPQKGSIVFDVGGELGLETKQFSKIVGDKGMVYTFECLPSHIDTLKGIANNTTNVQLVEYACWNKKQKLTFYEGHTPGSGTAVTEAKGQRGQTLANTRTPGLTVNANTLDNLWREYANGEAINFLKMDIEGAEYEALEGASELLENTKNAVIAAYHMREGERTASKVEKMLKAKGFQVRTDENYHVYATRS